MTAIVQKSNQIDSGHEFGNEGWQKFSVPPEQANQHGCIREIKHVISGRQSAFRQTMETQEFGEHRPAMAGILAARKRERGESGSGPQLSQRLLSYCCFEYFMTAYTSRNVATSAYRRDTALKSTGAGKRGTL